MEENLKNLTLVPESPQLQYNKDKRETKIIKWTARKIVLAIIELFSFMSTPLEEIKYLLVFLNEGNTDWIKVIRHIYPTIELHIYGENLNITEIDDKIIHYKKVFTDEDVTKWYNNRNNTAILSMYKSNLMDKIRAWIYTIDAKENLVYFKMSSNLKPEDNYIFLKGYIFKPVWDSYNSTHAWIYPQKYLDKDKYKYVPLVLNKETWENRMMYQNSIVREKDFFENPINVPNKDAPIYAKAGFNNNFDSYAEVVILDRFFHQFRLNQERMQYIKSMIDTISNMLTNNDKNNNPLLNQ